MIGTVVGNYKVVGKIGEGGMGAVYKGIDLMLEREVAIKVLKPELGSQPLVVERFRSEAVTLAKLNHPNIATLFSFFRQGDLFFMVLEYVSGITLDSIIEAHGVMTCEQAIPLFCQMLEGIDHAHSLGIIHRDIKPANMMLTENGLLKVLDFGIARALGSARMTRAGNLIGTIEYMSPEQVRGMETDARSDIYSLGMVLYELLTGRVPFASDSEYELMKAQVEQLPTPPREFAPNIPEAVEWAILCATEKDPANRFQTAGAFSSAIVDCVKTAIATGQLSQIDMNRPTGRLNVSSSVSDLLGSRSGTASQPGVSQSGVSAELPKPLSSAETQRLPSATRIAGEADLAALAPQSTEGIRMTRFAQPAEMAMSGVNMSAAPTQAQPSPSILSRLNWKHYVGAAGIGAVLLIILIVPLTIFLSNRPRSTSSAGPAPTPQSPVDQTNPESISNTESTGNSQSHRSTDSIREQSPVKDEPVRDIQARDPVSPDETQKTRKIGKTTASSQDRARRRALAQKALDK